MPKVIVDSQTAAETSVRQLIANGKSKVALEAAKDLHKRSPGANTEALLVDAYCARISALLEHKMAVEAQALTDLVRQKFPAYAGKLEGLAASAAARAESLSTLLAPLRDPQLDPAKRIAIETAIRREVYDLSALSLCNALDSGHPLRVAAAALSRGFGAVTSGPVDRATLEFPELSRRSPLAPWKPLILALAHFYRGEDAPCREFLSVIPPDSAPARLAPSIQAALGDKPSTPLTPAAASLVGRLSAGAESLRKSFDELHHSFVEDSDAQVFRRIQTAFAKCREHAPELAGKLRERVAVRCGIHGIDRKKTASAMGGEARADFAFFRLFALGMERQEETEAWGVANSLWDDALRSGVKEALFKPNGPEAAEIYVHMAAVMQKTPRRKLTQVQFNTEAKGREAVEQMYFLFPERLYQRAAAILPRAEVFASWLEWAKKEPGFTAEHVAEAWRKASPGDIQPLIYLIQAKAGRKSFNDALKYLAEAERIDGVHPGVRMQRARLLTGNFLNQLKRKNPRLAMETLEKLSELPAVREADRPAFLAALAWLAARIRQDYAAVHELRKQVEDLLGDRVAAGILLCAVSPAAKLEGHADIELVHRLTLAERASIPAGLARVFALGHYFGLEDLRPTIGYCREAVRQLPEVAGSLDLAHIQCLADDRVAARGEIELAYAAAGAGMSRGGGLEARFLLSRALSLPDWLERRRVVCLAAAAELARERRDNESLKKAVEALHEMDASSFKLLLAEAREVLAKEKSAPEFPSAGNPGPDYAELFEGGDLCQCPECRRHRGEPERNENSTDFLDEIEIPPGMPAELARVLLDEVSAAIGRGETPNEFVEKMFGGASPRKKKHKRK